MASAKTARAVLVILVAIAVALTALLIRPFATSLFLAAVLAGAVAPWMERLAGTFRGRRAPAAILLSVGVLLAVILPLAGLTAVVVKQVVSGVAWIRQALESEGTAGLVARLPSLLRPMAERALQELPQGLEQLEALATTQAGGKAAALAGGLITATTSALFQTAMFLIAFFFLLTDGRRLVEWLNEVVPLKRGQVSELLADFRRVTVVVLVSTVATDAVQSVLAFGGYLVMSVPSPLFFALFTFIIGLIPGLGASVAVLLVAGLQLLTGHAGRAIFLAAWGLLVVGMIDNVVKPLFMRGGLEVHGAIIFFALLGGLAAFGPVGLLAGPLVVAFLIAVVRMYRRDFGGPR